MTTRIKIFLTVFFLSLPIFWGINFFQQNLEKFFYAQISQPFKEMVFVKIPEKNLKAKLELQAKSALSVKIKENGREITLFKKNSEVILPIASLTKLMTALVVLENPRDYDFSKIITISKTAADQDDVPNYGNLKAGENFKIKKLLDLMLVYSSNDAAFALAEVLGSENFVKIMNLKTKELNLADSHFVNPTGLDPEDLHFASSTQNYFNYSTAKDLFSLVKYILKEYSLIFEIFSNGGPYAITNGISEISSPEDLMILGGKTGYTDEAGGCMLLVLVSDQGDSIINIILGALSVKERVEQMQKLINLL